MHELAELLTTIVRATTPSGVVYPDITINMQAVSGHPDDVIDAVTKALRRHGVREQEIETFERQARSVKVSEDPSEAAMHAAMQTVRMSW
jgi:hypothetical protein